MKYVLSAFLLLCCFSACAQENPKLQVLAFYSENVEHDHVDFAHQAIAFYSAEAKKDHFEFASTKNWNDLNEETLAKYEVVMWLNDSPHTQQQRSAFENYMEHGGGWLGFHVAAYNDADTHWPWFVQFLGGAVFYGNNWPPLPAKLIADDNDHPLLRNIPKSFLAPANEWYIWNPSPRLNKDVKVLLTLAPESFPLGLKDVIAGGDVPLVWTNTHYRMLYMNMGHGDKIFTNPTQNHLFENALHWIASPKSVQ